MSPGVAPEVMLYRKARLGPVTSPDLEDEWCLSHAKECGGKRVKTKLVSYKVLMSSERSESCV